MPQITLSRGRVYSYSHIVGRSQDTPPPGFSYPYGMAVGKDGMVYVANRAAVGHPCVCKVWIATVFNVKRDDQRLPESCRARESDV